MLWSLFCFWGYSMASRDSGIKKCFLFRFGDRHYENTVAISVINSVMQMNGFPPRAVSRCRNSVRVQRRRRAQLIAAGADVKNKNKQGKIAEMLAIENNHTDLAELLRRAGARRSHL